MSPPSRTASPRVLFVIPGDGQGSSMIFARRQADALRAQGIEIREFFLRSRTAPLTLLLEACRFLVEVRAFSPNVVHAHYGTVTALFSALCAGRIPLVITYRGSDLNPTPGSPVVRSSVAHLLSQIAALRAARIVCVSRRLSDRLWWRRERVTILVSGVDDLAFQPISRTAARQRLGWQFSTPAILFNCGRDPRIKRLDLAQAAVDAARRAVPDLHWEVLDGSTPPGLIPTFMSAADCLLVTSDFEGSPTVVQEALASNLPIVSVAAGDVPERIEGVANTQIAARDPEALGAALARMIAPPRRSDGRRKIAEYSADGIARRLRALYAELLPTPL
jgi:teichuronic acid biosynthesis glycosyltransferase TuaC